MKILTLILIKIKDLILNIFYFFKRALHHLKDRDVQLMVYALSFVTMLSFIPFIVVILGFFKWAGFLNFLYPKVELIIVKKFSGAISLEVSRQLQTLLKRSYAGSWGFVNITFLIVTTSRLAAYFEKAVNHIWHVKNPKNIFKRIISHWILIMLFPIGLAADVTVRSFIVNATKFESLPSILSFFFLNLILTIIYKWLPNRFVKLKVAFFSALCSSVMLIALQNSFRFISKKSFSYSKFYGSLATLPIFMIWISTVWLIILLGVSIAAGWQKAKEQKENNIHPEESESL